MPTVARLIGGAGTGKTTELMRILDDVLGRGFDPLQIGFVSFTRAARREASSRAVDKFGGSVEQLEQDGWFRTLHSICFRGLGEARGRLLGDDRASRAWTKKNLGDDTGKALGGENVDSAADGSDTTDAPDAEHYFEFETSTEIGRSLAIWDAARNRLEPLQAAWERSNRASSETPSLDDVRAVVEQYEQAKRLDDRADFTDMLGRFAGWRFSMDGSHAKVYPEGYAPPLPVWFFDEQQDTSALLDSVCHRLIAAAKWVYVVGDPFQAIYGWAGADPKHFLGWDVAQERIMPKSYRCPSEIHEFGESVLRGASDYWDRGIAAADHDGTVQIERMTKTLFDEITPDESWLLLARSNRLAQKLSMRIKEMRIPWAPTRGLGGWLRPVWNVAVQGLVDAQNGLPIFGAEWSRILDLLPSNCDAGPLVVRGTKSRWGQAKYRKEHEAEGGYVEQILAEHWGGTQTLVDAIKNGSWVDFVAGAREYRDGVEKWGYKNCTEPKIRVGTVHSVKGAEADNVIWLTTTTQAVTRACEDQDSYNEECRVAYVAATRARKRLIVAVEPNQRNKWVLL